MTTAHLTEAEHATLIALLDERRLVTEQRKRAKLIASRRPYTLAQKLEKERPFVERLAELNDQIDKLMKREGESE